MFLWEMKSFSSVTGWLLVKCTMGVGVSVSFYGLRLLVWLFIKDLFWHVWLKQGSFCLTLCVCVELWMGGTAEWETPQPAALSPSRGLVENSRWSPPSSPPPLPSLPSAPLSPPPSSSSPWWWSSSWGCSSKLRVELMVMMPLQEETQKFHLSQGL